MGGIKGIAGSIAPFAGFIPGIGIPAAAALGGGLGAIGGGFKGALGGALGAGGLAGGGGALGNFLGAGSGAAGTALGSGLLGAAGGALGGGAKGALLGGALGGAGGYIQGSGGIGNAFDNIKNSVTGGVASPAGGLSSAYSASAGKPGIFSRITDELGFTGNDINTIPASQVGRATTAMSASGAANAAKGILANAGNIGTQAASSSPNYLTPLLSAGIGGFSNQRATDQLLEGQQNAFNTISPFLSNNFDPSQLASDPGYQFQLQQGEAALGRLQSARGNYYSGDAIREGLDFNKGLTDTTLQDAYGRYANDQNRKIGLASGLADIYGNMGNVQANSTTNLGNILTGSLAAATGGNAVNSSGQIVNPNSNMDPYMLAWLRSQGRA